MRALLEWVMAARWRATAIVAVMALLPLVNLVSAAMLALVTLRHGLREGLLVALMAGTAVFALDLVAGMPLERVILVVMMTWLPVLLLAQILRISQSQARVLQAVAILGCGIVVGIFAATGDPAVVWQEFAETRLMPWLDEAGVAYNREAVAASLPEMSRMMTGLAAGFWMLGHWLALVAGRWCQAVLYKPGGFRSEFHALRLGPGMTIAAGLVFIAATLTGQALIMNLALVLVLVYAVQGLAVMHGVVGYGGLHWLWLAVLYVLAGLLLPHMIALMAVTGFIDQWADFRAKIAGRSGNE